jgi:UDP-N-acetyl-D-glucosamine dehydrogenase
MQSDDILQNLSFGIFIDNKILQHFQHGCEVKGLGSGHIQRIKDEIRIG